MSKSRNVGNSYLNQEDRLGVIENLTLGFDVAERLKVEFQHPGSLFWERIYNEILPESEFVKLQERLKELFDSVDYMKLRICILEKKLKDKK